MSERADPLELAHRVADRLGGVPGVAAVVLGGSRARERARPDSDIDLGVYYRAALAPGREAFQAVASSLGSGDVTEIGDWGPWVNGGAWLDIEGWRVDLLYREVERVATVIEDCRAGRISADYYLGHPHAFHNHIYLGELACAVPLHDPERIVTAMKALVRRYPPAMKAAVVQRYLYDAGFMLELARKPAARGDVFHVSGCAFRVVAALVQVILALNETYFVNEKGALEEAAALPISPVSFARRGRALLAKPGATRLTLKETLAGLAEMVAEVRSLAEAQPA